MMLLMKKMKSEKIILEAICGDTYYAREHGRIKEAPCGDTIMPENIAELRKPPAGIPLCQRIWQD